MYYWIMVARNDGTCECLEFENAESRFAWHTANFAGYVPQRDGVEYTVNEQGEPYYFDCPENESRG